MCDVVANDLMVFSWHWRYYSNTRGLNYLYAVRRFLHVQEAAFSGPLLGSTNSMGGFVIILHAIRQCSV